MSLLWVNLGGIESRDNVNIGLNLGKSVLELYFVKICDKRKLNFDTNFILLQKGLSKIQMV